MFGLTPSPAILQGVIQHHLSRQRDSDAAVIELLAKIHVIVVARVSSGSLTDPSNVIFNCPVLLLSSVVLLIVERRVKEYSVLYLEYSWIVITVNAMQMK